MEFEKTLRERLYQQELESVERDFETRYKAKLDSYDSQVVKYGIRDAYSIYVEQKMQGLTKKQLCRLFDEFEQATTEENLEKMKNRITLERQEKEYIAYSELKNMFDGKQAVKEVLLRRALLEKLKGEKVENIIQVLREYIDERFRGRHAGIDYATRLISGEVFSVQEKLKKKIAQNVTHNFNQYINCGGYALKVDTWVCPRNSEFDTRVSGILEAFPFVRLLGDTKLQEDEYLVLYRARGRRTSFHSYRR